MQQSLRTGASGVAEAVPARFYSEDLHGTMQRLLVALADIDFAFDRDAEQLRVRALPPEDEADAVRQLREEHGRRREPYIRLLNEVHGQLVGAARRA
jgi:hypothetical protein